MMRIDQDMKDLIKEINARQNHAAQASTDTMKRGDGGLDS
jgi:acyl carrier protein